MKLAAVATLVALSAARVASADPEPSYDATQPVNEHTALALSLGSTVASLGLAYAGASSNNVAMAGLGAVGTLVGPSVGHWYAHEGFSRGMALRAGGATLGVVALGIAASNSCPLYISDDSGSSNPNPCQPKSNAVPAILAALGGLAYVAGAADDIITAPSAARRYNEARAIAVTVVPTIAPGANGGGLAVAGSF